MSFSAQVLLDVALQKQWLVRLDVRDAEVLQLRQGRQAVVFARRPRHKTHLYTSHTYITAGFGYKLVVDKLRAEG